MKKVFFIFILLMFTACSSNNIDEDTSFRVNLLYAHTLQMKALSSDSQLLEIGMDPKWFPDQEIKDTIKKIELMESSFGITPKGTYEARITLLEDTMLILMDRWVAAQNY
ncbi:hypothetical protein HN799_02065 [Candidatus Woesearchaeota archaeon]|jgi:hypothetical protein|nr:hypothetical protein [Candidatus Woesearchaeota archaeon]MBT4151115.1 hypothetical protein [Candidatus Woesearchaeota archaeon]MBT4247933.1 hypothetical protein [Candidatus Woesearchaeota archaeon]MBT7332033.1 hypothetical protein [Candidatus Woesearchaeota archaeon]